MTDMLDRIAEIIDPVAFMTMSVHLSRTHKAAAMDHARRKAVAVLRVLREPDSGLWPPEDTYGNGFEAGWNECLAEIQCRLDAILPKEEKSHDYYSRGYVAKQPIPGEPPRSSIAALTTEVERLTAGLERIRGAGTWRPSAGNPDGTVWEGEPRMHMLAGMADAILKEEKGE